MNNDYNSFPFYHDAYFCEKCGSFLKDEEKLVNLELENNYQRKIKRKCKKCGYSHHFISKIFTGASGERYIGKFDPSGEMITSSGVLTKNGHWDPDGIAKENRAKNFKINVELDKARKENNDIP